MYVLPCSYSTSYSLSPLSIYESSILLWCPDALTTPERPEVCISWFSYVTDDNVLLPFFLFLWVSAWKPALQTNFLPSFSILCIFLFIVLHRHPFKTWYFCFSKGTILLMTDLNKLAPFFYLNVPLLQSFFQNFCFILTSGYRNRFLKFSLPRQYICKFS